MKKIIETIKNWFKKEQFFTLGTSTFCWTNTEGHKTHSVGVLWQLGDRGTKRAKLVEQKDKWYDVKNHPYYHAYILPWENSTGWANTNDPDILQHQINQLCDYNTDYEPINKAPKHNTKSSGNIISVDFSAKDR